MKMNFDDCAKLLEMRDVYITKECEKFIHRCRYKGEISINVDDFRNILQLGYNRAIHDIEHLDDTVVRWDEEDNEDE